MHRHLLFFLLILPAGLAAVNVFAQPPPKRYAFSEPHMGTTFRIVLYAADEATAKKAAAAAFARVGELNKIMSDYDPDSELMQLCRKAGGPPVPVSADLFKVLHEAEKFARLSDGAFDVSIAPVVRLWRKARKTRELPSAAEIKKALDLVDWQKIRLDPEGRTVQLLLMGMLLDLGGIAKGYAADAVLEVLRRHGITRALVAAGGDIAVGDPPPDAPGWRVGIAPLRDPNAGPTHTLLLKNAAVSTSGDSHQAVKIAGTRYSHIVDPKTGLGLVGRRSVSVIARDATTTDALATAVCVMGPERGLKLVESREDWAGLFVSEAADGKERAVASKTFAKHVAADNK